MKKALSLIAVAAFATSFVGCGPSQEEMERRNQDKKDSIAAVEQHRQDSIANAAMEQERMEQEAAADTSAAATEEMPAEPAK